MEEEEDVAEEYGLVARLSEYKAKDPRSDSRYNIFSRLFFCWVGWLMRHGFRHDLEQSDLFAHPREADSAKLHQKFWRYWNQELQKKAKGGTPRLSLVIIKCFWWRFILQGLLSLSEIAMNIGLALLLGQLARYLSLPCERRNATETRNAYIQGAAMVLLGVLITFIHAHAFLVGQMIGMLTRIMMTSAIYNKVLTLSQVTIGKISIGHVINLASNDVQRYDLAFLFVHIIWIAPLHMAVTTYLVYLEIGWSSFILMALIVAVVPLQFFSAKLYSKLRFKSARLTDKRIRIMNEVIVGIRVIKMYAWEHAFKRVVQELRKHEIKLVAFGGTIRTLTMAFNLGGVVPFVFGTVFLVYAGSGGELTAQRVFTTLSLINIVRRISVTFIIRCFFHLYEASVANTRIQNLLLLEEQFPSLGVTDSRKVQVNEKIGPSGYFRPESPWLAGTRKINLDADGPVELKSVTTVNMVGADKNPSLRVSDLSASWSGDKDKLVLEGINFKLDSSAPLLSVIGPVGSGKSTLHQCLMGELGILNGNIDKNGALSYASQEPWVYSGTVRENITFGLPYNRIWYDKVIEACALLKDIKSFIDGDLTVVGERGVTLSGGQKARVNLARAVYRDADIVLLDDPLSAVDAAVGKHLFDNCLRGILKDKLVILITHQVHFALEADQLLVLKKGQVEMYETISDLAARNIDTRQLLGLIRDNDSEEKADDKYAYENGSDNSDEVEDEYKYSSPNKNKDQDSLTSGNSMLSIHSDKGTSLYETDTKVGATVSEEKAHGSISTMTYINYFRAGAHYLSLVLVFFIFVLAEAGVVVADWWLSNWALCFRPANVSQAPSLDNNTCPVDGTTDIAKSCSISRSTRYAVYGSVVYSTVLIHFVRGILFYLVCINASKTLHNKMFSNILRVPVRFFDTNASGRILNRFSKDVGFMDDLIPVTFFTFLALFIRFLGILIVAVAANPYLMIVLPFLIVMYLLLRWYYLKAARNVKRLEALARSPVYSHLSTTLQGLPTVRLFEQQNVAFNHFHHYNNEHTKGWYLYLVTTRWFGIRLDLISNLLLLFAVGFSVPLVAHTNAGLDPGLLGLGLTYVVGLAGMFQFCVRQSAELENQMVSTERVIQYSRLENEASLETVLPQNKPPASWPGEGQISMDNVAFQYSDSLPLVLKNLSFSVRPTEKVGIVGRTGAGKSSLISVLFRMAEPAGSIRIDGIDAKSIGLHDLRKKISIIPQDPVLFSGTVRYNLDPFDQYSDAELWGVLEQVQLKSAVEEMDGQLSAEVSEAGGNFSVGQRQLMCLGRALLRKNKILILDEATANVDPKTDGIIQQAIREKFVDCTVLTIAHRLNTIMDSDRILVMSNGRVKEFGSPYRLLQNPDSQLYKMVEKTGPEASEKLHQMAIEARSRANRKMSIF